jgi:two-component system cell cycle response regulator
MAMHAGKPVVLLVDDDPAMLRLLAKWLEGEGYVVRRASDGEEAIAEITADCPDILVTDWEMPQVDGMDLCRWVRRADLPHYLYTIFLTVRSNSVDMVRGLEAGADDFLKKPVDRSELLARIRAGTRVLELESRLSLLAKLDPLTGLFTQRTFHEEANKEWSRGTRHPFPISCVMIDLDFFKRINDVYGHGVGDDVLRRVARVMQNNCRSSDIVSRYGGEEFCCLLPETDETQAAMWADRVRQEIGATKFFVDEVEFSVTASLGVAERLTDTASLNCLVESADQALLVAKGSGRDRVVMHHTLHRHGNCGVVDNRERLFAGVTAKSVMTTIVAGLSQDETIGQATRYFLRMRIGSAPVTSSEGKLIGILSDKDCLASMLVPGWAQLSIREIMKHNVVCYEEDTPVQQIYEFLCRVSIRTVVIVKCGVPVGVITRGSLLRWASNVFRAEQLGRTSTSREHTCDATGCETPRERILRTALAVAREGEKLGRLAQNGDNDLTPCVVGGASRIQELVTDLLACSRYANDATDNDLSHESENSLAARIVAGPSNAAAVPVWLAATATPQQE